MKQTIKERLQKVYGTMHKPLHELAHDESVNTSGEANNKFNVLLDALWDLGSIIERM